MYLPTPGTQVDLLAASLKLAAAVLLAFVLHSILFASLRRLGSLRSSFAVTSFIRYTSRPVRLLLLLLAFSAVLPPFMLPAGIHAAITHLLEVGYILVIGWLAIGAVEIVSSLIRSRLPEDIQDNVKARRTHTQVHLLRQIVIGLIAFSSVAAVLVTFPTIRSIGAGMFASAGLAGLALGMAARPALANVIAGIQIALTEPIRIDDAVFLEGEFGRVLEVNTTHVVVRLWDLRNMIVPLSYFIEKPFQNWTRNSSELIGVVFIHTDYMVPMDRVRAEFERVVTASPLWDGKVKAVQITDATEHAMQIRFLASAINPPTTFDLRCQVREKMIAYLQTNYPECLPRVRASLHEARPPD